VQLLSGHSESSTDLGPRESGFSGRKDCAPVAAAKRFGLGEDGVGFVSGGQLVRILDLG
jgi:hypothetical protein